MSVTFGGIVEWLITGSVTPTPFQPSISLQAIASLAVFVETTDTLWLESLAGNLFWRIGSFESNPPIFSPTNYYSMMSAHVHVITWCHNHVSTVVQNVRTKAANFVRMEQNSPDFIYHQLVPARFDLLWFEADPAVLTLQTTPISYITKCHY